MVKCIVYKDDYNYQLKKSYVIHIPISLSGPIHTDFICLETSGELTIKEGYAWDGATFAPDIPSIMRGSLIHDALYQLMRRPENGLDGNVHRETADLILKDICKEDGMWVIVAWLVYLVVHHFAAPAADPANKHPFKYRPNGCQQ